MIQLVPSLKYNRSIDSAVNLALINIQKKEQRQQRHASHIHMAMPNYLRNIDSQGVPKGCPGSLGAFRRALVDTAKY